MINRGSSPLKGLDPIDLTSSLPASESSLLPRVGLSCGAMSDITETANADECRDRGGRFVIGGKPGPGRPAGARSKLGQAFLEDLRDAWNEHGQEALRRCATEDPSQFCRIISNLLPRDIDINLATTVDAASFAERFRTAVELLGNEHQQMPKQKTIEKAHAGRRR